MVKIIMGAVFIAGGLSGKLVLIGTHSGPALALFGGVLIVWGIFQVMSRRR
jgi:hypothetical protein